jgi:beta-phosphoglucomutase-like phosphatase (HAD superfamily)
MPAEAVLFDVDGTLVDSVDLHARAWQEAFAHFGKRFPWRKSARRSAKAAISSCRSSSRRTSWRGAARQSKHTARISTDENI